MIFLHEIVLSTFRLADVSLMKPAHSHLHRVADTLVC